MKDYIVSSYPRCIRTLIIFALPLDVDHLRASRGLLNTNAKPHDRAIAREPTRSNLKDVSAINACGDNVELPPKRYCCVLRT